MPLGQPAPCHAWRPRALVLFLVDIGGSHAVTDLDVRVSSSVAGPSHVLRRVRSRIFTGRPHPGTKDVGLFTIRPADHDGIRTIGAVSTTETGDSSGGAGATCVVPGSDRSRRMARASSIGSATLTASGSDPYGINVTCRVRTGQCRFGRWSGCPHVSPDGTMVVYETRVLGLEPAAVLRSYRRESAEPTNRTEFSNMDRQGFDFSPDGKEVFLTAGTPPVTMIDRLCNQPDQHHRRHHRGPCVAASGAVTGSAEPSAST